MRIEAARSHAQSAAGAVRRGGENFAAFLAERRPVNARGAQSAHNVSGLLSLQVEDGPDPIARRRARKGLDVLDTLDRMKAEMINGRVSDETLDELVFGLSDLGPKTHDRRLEAMIDDLELRVRVELAKRGR